MRNGFVGTYRSGVRRRRNTLGGYSDNIVVDEKYVLRISHTDNLAAVAPLLCAGITTYSPLRWKVGPGQKVGVVGLGGLGHMAVKIANAMGAKVVLFTTSPDKREDALRLGAAEVVVSKNKEEMAAHVNSFDFILNTVAAPHNLDAFVNLLKRDATMTLVGGDRRIRRPACSAYLQAPPHRRLVDWRHRRDPGDARLLRRARHRLGHRDDPHADINEAYERMLKSDVKYRFVIDMATLKAA